jgi:SNF2 family DNA or RNA helicase
MKWQPHDYQKRVIGFMSKTKTPALFLDMGLGKTSIILTHIALLYAAKKVKSVLVVAPLRAIYTTWPDEIEKWDHLKWMTCSVVHGDDKFENLHKDATIHLINPHGIKWLFDNTIGKNKTKRFDLVVIDESTDFKARNTTRWKKMKHLIQPAQYRIIATGTPAPNSLLDLWAQYYLLDSGGRLGRSYNKFKQTHFTKVDYMGRKWEPKKATNKLLSARVKDITVALQADDYLKMPDTIVNDVKCILPDDLREQYDRLEEEFFIELEGGEEVEAFNPQSLSMKLRQFIQGRMYTEENKTSAFIHSVKLDALQEIVNTNHEPHLASVQFRFEYESIKKLYPKAEFIVGGVKVEKSTELIQQWNKGEIEMLVCHPKSLSHAVNLQAGGRSIIWLGQTWSQQDYMQLNARIRRQGQTRSVLIHRLIMKNTVDELMIASLAKKFKTQAEFIDYAKRWRKEKKGGLL